jgi:hypothetical protein
MGLKPIAIEKTPGNFKSDFTECISFFKATAFSYLCMICYCICRCLKLRHLQHSIKNIPIKHLKAVNVLIVSILNKVFTTGISANAR